VTTGVVGVVSWRELWTFCPQLFGRTFCPSIHDQRGPRAAADAHDQEQQLPADIGVKGIKVDPAQLVNTDATSERIVGMAA
jgi:hypothetical protein